MKPEHVKVVEGETLLIYNRSLYQYAGKEREAGSRMDKNEDAGVWVEFFD
jgi:hypothetical protein